MNASEIRERIRSTSLKTVKIHVPEWETDVYIKELSGRIYSEISTQSLVDNKIDSQEFINRAIIASCFDENGEQIFTNNDFDMVNGLSGDVFSQLVSKITEINHILGVSNPKN